jgi:hypothetical protein
LHLAQPTTAWTWLFGPKHAGLFLQEFVNGSLGHRTGCLHRYLFDVVSVEIEVGPDLVVNPPRHNSPPALCHVTDPS